jgi:5'(3')-deoxyribonucleotidase
MGKYEIERIFLCDMDGPLTKLHKKVASRLSEKIGEQITEKDCTNNSPSKGFAHVHRQAKEWVEQMLAEPGFYRDLEVVEGAQKNLFDLQTAGLRIVILSSYGNVPACVPDKAAYLSQHFGWINPRDFIFSSLKPLVRGRYFMDDGAEYLAGWKLMNPFGTTFTLARPYTKETDAEGFCRDWNEVHDWIMDK